jgi:hypothetical protein
MLCLCEHDKYIVLIYYLSLDAYISRWTCTDYMYFEECNKLLVQIVPLSNFQRNSSCRTSSWMRHLVFVTAPAIWILDVLPLTHVLSVVLFLYLMMWDIC